MGGNLAINVAHPTTPVAALPFTRGSEMPYITIFHNAFVRYPSRPPGSRREPPSSVFIVKDSKECFRMLRRSSSASACNVPSATTIPTRNGVRTIITVSRPFKGRPQAGCSAGRGSDLQQNRCRQRKEPRSGRALQNFGEEPFSQIITIPGIPSQTG